MHILALPIKLLKKVEQNEATIDVTKILISNENDDWTSKYDTLKRLFDLLIALTEVAQTNGKV